MYYKIAHDHARHYQDRDTEHSKLRTDLTCAEELSEISRRLEQCYEERARSAVIAITFAGMALEAFFYDYAADQLGDAFVKDHLDKLDLPSKFLEYPRLICGKSPDKSRAAYGSLKSLVSLRNRLVHFKSKPFNLDKTDEASDFHDELNKILHVGVDRAIEAVRLVLTELGALQGDRSLFVQRLKWSIGEI